MPPFSVRPVRNTEQSQVFSTLIQDVHDMDQELSAEVLDCPGQGDSRDQI